MPKTEYLPEEYKTCRYCEKKFISSSENRFYCSRQCFKMARKEYEQKLCKSNYAIKMTCKHCGLFMNRKTYHSGGCCNKESCIDKEKLHRKKLAQRKHYNTHVRKSKRDKKKEAESSRRHRKNNPTKMRAVEQKKRLERKQKREWITNYKESKSCEKCGENRWFCLDFHHLDISQKKLNMAGIVYNGCPLAVIKAEADKCILLCANCHRHLHFLFKGDLTPEQTFQWLNSVEKLDFLSNDIKYLDDDYTECVHCKKKFIFSPNHVKYCSDECFETERLIKRRVDSKRKYNKQMTCKHCGTRCYKHTYHSHACCNAPECIEAEKIYKRKSVQQEYYDKHIKSTEAVAKSEKKKMQKELKRRSDRFINNKEHINKTKRLAKKQKRDWLDDYKKNASCACCGEKRWFCLDFHHIDSSSKTQKISDLIRCSFGFKVIQRELEKCIVLCTNCHRHLHFDCEKKVSAEQTEEWLNKNRKKEYA